MHLEMAVSPHTCGDRFQMLIKQSVDSIHLIQHGMAIHPTTAAKCFEAAGRSLTLIYNDLCLIAPEFAGLAIIKSYLDVAQNFEVIL